MREINTLTRIKRVIRFSHTQEKKRDLICQAINQMRPIEFYYLDGYRVVEPFALGIVLTDKQDNESLLCWQTGGMSDLKDVEGWKLYRVSNMHDIALSNEHFNGDRPGYDPVNLEMVPVICCVEPVKHPEEAFEPEPPPQRLKIEVPPAPVYEPLPEVTLRRKIKPLTHNQLMELFRHAHPEEIPQLKAMEWLEPIALPTVEKVEEVVEEPPSPKVWPETPVYKAYAGQTA